jgi:uncharacterized protein YndB with AHSA1/START domain
MRVQASILIERPIEAIFICVTSAAFLQQWVAPFRVEKYDIPPESHYREVQHMVRYPELRQVSEGALGVGTTFKQSNEARDHLSEATIEIIEYEPPTTFTLKVMTEMDLSQIKWVFQHASGGGTRATLIWEQKQQDWRAKLLGLFVLLVFRNKIAGSPEYMQRLKNYLADQC